MLFRFNFNFNFNFNLVTRRPSGVVVLIVDNLVSCILEKIRFFF